MAGQTSGDRPADCSTNGSIEGQHESIAPGSKALEDDQTFADREQTLADADQTGSDGDQTASDNDQAAADCDQEASDRDLVQGGDPATHEITREIRDHSAQQRQHGAQQRVDTGAARDAVARARDLTALARDQAAAQRDRELTALARAEAAAQRDRELAAREAALTDDGRAVTDAEIVQRARRRTARVPLLIAPRPSRAGPGPRWLASRRPSIASRLPVTGCAPGQTATRCCTNWRSPRPTR